jgi:hypothetical protein
MVNEWWKFWMNKREFSSALQTANSVLYSAIVSKTHAFQYLTNNVFSSHANIGIPGAKWWEFSCLQSTHHEGWSWKYASTMKGDRRYLPSECYETFPFPQSINPQQEQHLETIGETYHEHRKQLMLGIQLGLTKTYNLFYSNAITAQSINEKDKQVIMLRKHLEKTANTISFNEAVHGIIKLRALHVQMDEAVLSAYGWSNYELKITNYDNASKALISNSQLKIDLKHDFYEVDYLPENDRVRYTIHPDARKEVLKRLLELNHKIHEEEVKAGLWDKKGKNGKGGRGGNGTNNNSNDDDDIPDEELGGLFSQQ